VFAPSLSGFLVMALLIPVFLFGIKMEEDMLTEHFGDEYKAYRTATKKLVPFFY
jgi:protein-S-isoprenylcysteine O-methyltransferase Ste14